MKLTSLLLLLASFGWGQSTQPTVAFVPFGPWPVCESDGSVNYLSTIFGTANYCATLTKGSEPDLLSIKSATAATTDFLYIATGIDSTGAQKTVTGHLKRNDNASGFSSTIVNAGMKTALVTVVEYSYDPVSGSFSMLQNNTDLYKYPAVAAGSGR